MFFVLEVGCCVVLGLLFAGGMAVLGAPLWVCVIILSIWLVGAFVVEAVKNK